MASVALTPERSRGGLLAPVEPAQWRAFANWLLVWMVVANVGFALMWIVGAPPRWTEILAIGAIGLVVRERAYWVRATGFVFIMAYSVLGFISGLFNLSISSLLYSIRFFLELDPAKSLDYVIGSGVIGLLAYAGARLAKRHQHFSDIRLVLLAFVAVISLAIVDSWMGMGMRGHYKRAAVAGTPFTSAIEQTGFGAAAGEQQRHLMIVMVESMGVPVDNPEMDRLLFARYQTPAIEQRFEVTAGSTPYYNSTTAAEVRELCRRWGDYYDVLDRLDETCLPARLRDQGYETRAYHSFTGDFFERSAWYPNIGFDKSLFGPDLVAQGARECGGVFPGACDRDIPAMLAARLRDADTPQFLYWLTLNSHLPVPPGLNLDVDRCERVSPELAENYPMICRQFAIWDAVDAALVREVTAQDFPPTDILIVGDHMPPYFDRHHRRQFAPDRVPWLMLRWKQDRAEPATRAQGAAASEGDRQS